MFKLLEDDKPKFSPMCLLGISVDRIPAGESFEEDRAMNADFVYPPDWEDLCEEDGRTVDQMPLLRSGKPLVALDITPVGFWTCQDGIAPGTPYEFEVEQVGLSELLEGNEKTLMEIIDKYVPPDASCGACICIFEAHYDGQPEDPDVVYNFYDAATLPNLLGQMFLGIPTVEPLLKR